MEAMGGGPAMAVLASLERWQGAREKGRKGGDTEAGLGANEEARVQRGGHWLRVTGGLVWCTRCACYAHRRHGAGLKGVCKPGRSGAARARLARLHQGLHPVTGSSLVG